MTLLPRIVAVASVGLCAIGVTPPIAAAESQIEEVVITAQKREESLMDVPQSVQSFDTDFLESQNVRDFVRAVNFIPGASASFSGGAGSQLYNLRGTGAQGRIGLIAIGFYIDDIPWVAGGPFGPPVQFFDLESLEVLRGPQGTLYGQGSMGGTFVVRTAKPDMHDLDARGQMWSSDEEEGQNSWGWDATVSVPIVQDKLALRLTGGRGSFGGLAETPDQPFNKNIDNYDQTNERAKLRWEVSDALSVTATYWHTEENRNFSPGIYATVDPPLILGTGGRSGIVEQDTDFSSILVDWDLSFAHLTSASSYVDNQGLFDADFAFDTVIAGQLFNNVLQLTVPAAVHTYNQEVRLSSLGGGPWGWVFGSEYTATSGDNSVISAFRAGPLVGLVPDSLSTNSGNGKSWSVFGELSRDFMDGKLTPLIGLRYFRDDPEIHSVTTFPASVYDRKAQFDSVSPRFNLRWRPNESTEIYGNIAKGFRSGVFNTPNQVATAAAFGIPLRFELNESNLWSYELGARFTMLDKRLRIEPAVYYENFSNYQFEGSAGTVNFALPIDTVEAVGADLIITYVTPIDGLTFSASGDYNQTEPTDIAAFITGTQAALKKNEQLPFVPKWGYTVQTDYERPIGGEYTGFGSVAWSERGSQTDFITGFTSQTMENLSLNLGMRTDFWGLRAWCTNCGDDKGPAVIAGGLQNRYDRRTIGLTLTGSMRRGH
jgi:iron complex outermembrane recepter protein